MTGVVISQKHGRRLIAHGSEKNIVSATENVESEKLLRCVHLSLTIDFCDPFSMAQYRRIREHNQDDGKSFETVVSKLKCNEVENWYR